MLNKNGSLGLIAGPCVIESEEHVHFLAREIRARVGEFIFVTVQVLPSWRPSGGLAVTSEAAKSLILGSAVSSARLMDAENGPNRGGT